MLTAEECPFKIYVYNIYYPSFSFFTGRLGDGEGGVVCFQFAYRGEKLWSCRVLEIKLEFFPSYSDWQLDAERWIAIFINSRANWAFFTTGVWHVVRQTMCQWGRRTWRAAAVSCSLMSPCTLLWCSAYGRLLINRCCILSKSLLSFLSKSSVRGQIFETLHLTHENNRTRRREFSRCHRFVGAKCSTSPVGLDLWDIWTGHHEIWYNAVLQYFLNPEQGFSTSHLPTKPRLAPKIVVRSIVAGMSSQEKRGRQ